MPKFIWVVVAVILVTAACSDSEESVDSEDATESCGGLAENSFFDIQRIVDGGADVESVQAVATATREQADAVGCPVDHLAGEVRSMAISLGRIDVALALGFGFAAGIDEPNVLVEMTCERLESVSPDIGLAFRVASQGTARAEELAMSGEEFRGALEASCPDQIAALSDVNLIDDLDDPASVILSQELGLLQIVAITDCSTEQAEGTVTNTSPIPLEDVVVMISFLDGDGVTREAGEVLLFTLAPGEEQPWTVTPGDAEVAPGPYDAERCEVSGVRVGIADNS